jgi:L-histidine N-alpha-methyltransferase
MAQSLRAKREIVANIRALDLAVTFLEGEEIHTEVSCKFTKAQISHDFDAAGLHLDGWLTDAQNRFALALGTKA